jgi:hypothetical protein
MSRASASETNTDEPSASETNTDETKLSFSAKNDTEGWYKEKASLYKKSFKTFTKGVNVVQRIVRLEDLLEELQELEDLREPFCKDKSRLEHA